MQHRDEFDGPGGVPDFRNIMGPVFRALDRRDRIRPRRPLWAASVVGMLVLFLACVLWYSYPRERERGDTIAAPVIHADAGPYKVAPSDPGGMEIPHRDSTVFETLHADRGEGAERIENLLDEPEEPVDREQVFAGLGELRVEGREVIAPPPESAEEEKSEDVASIDITEGGEAEPASPPPAAVAAVEQTPPAAAPEKTALAAAAAPPVPAKTEREEAEEASRTEPAAGVETFAAGGWFVQLASLSTQDAAQAAWGDMKKSLPVLSSLDHRVKRADLGAKGVYYRLQAGPYSEARAREICAAVKAKKPGGCLVVKD